MPYYTLSIECGDVGSAVRFEGKDEDDVVRKAIMILMEGLGYGTKNTGAMGIDLNLIAAAPELYELLKTVPCPLRADHEGISEYYANWLAKIKPLIARIEGEADEPEN